MSLIVVTGPMFAGKSTWIQNYVHRSSKISKRGLVVRPKHTARYALESPGLMTTHDEVSTIDVLEIPMDTDLGSHIVEHVGEEALRTGCLDYVVVDEAQFCRGLYNFAKVFVETYDIQVVLVGLLTDFKRRPFVDYGSGAPEFLECLCIADQHIQLTALCTHCRDGSPGIFTQRFKEDSDSVVVIGSSETYESVCRKHYRSKNS